MNRYYTIALSFTLVGCMAGPVTGDVDPAEPGIHAISLGGATNAQSTPVSLFVLNSPFNVASPTWGSLPSALTSSANSGTASDPWFTWSKSVTPSAVQWPKGGLLRVRAASAPSGSSVPADLYTFDSYVYDTTGTSCINTQLIAGASFGAAGSTCQSTYAIHNMATVVSSFTTPSAESGDVINYLGKRGNGGAVPPSSIPSDSKDFSDNYYASIGAPATLALFVSAYSFPTNEVHALYYNMGDLGIGRDMHCKSFTPPGYPTNSGKVCYVTNYGRVNNVVAKFGPAFGSLPTQTVIAQAEVGTTVGPVTNLAGDETASSANVPVATVAMIYNPAQATDNPVQFIVYNSDGVLSEYAALDNPGVVANSRVTKVINGIPTTVDHRDLSAAANLTVPNNCLTCHGTSSTYTPKHTTGAGSGHAQITKATFLPFDLDAIVFSTETTGPYTPALMTTAIKSLNAIVYDSAPTASVTTLLKGMYPSATNDGPKGTAAFDKTYVPAAWTSGGAPAIQVYNEVVKPYCRTCHVSHDAGRDWGAWNDFLTDPSIATDVCTNNSTVPMPQAEQTQTRFWKSPARAHLVNALSIGGACAP